MGDIAAVIVGIEKYGRSGINISSPFHNALTAATTLVFEMGVAPTKVRLLVNKSDASGATTGEAEIKALSDRGVRIEEPTRANIIDALAQSQAGMPADSRLFVYWCGHGYAGSSDRLLLCSDYAPPACTDRTFNATRRIARLASRPEFRCFREQLFLVDVCAKYSDNLEPDNIEVGGERHARQVAIFATRIGGYSKGGFSEVALAWLKRQRGWPEIDQVIETLLPDLMGQNLKPFTLDAESEATTIKERPFGAAPTPIYPAHVLEVQDLVGEAKLSAEHVRKSYQSTMLDLRLPIEGDPDLVHMLTEFAATLQYADPAEITDAFLQFALRLSFDPKAGRLCDWLDRLPNKYAFRRNSIKERLQAEANEKLLIVEVDGTPAGEPTAITAFACTRGGEWLSARQFERDVADWDEMSIAVNDALDVAFRQGIHVSEIQFAIRPFLFHREFHRIPRRTGGELGENYVVVLRDYLRAYENSPSADIVAHKQALLACSPGQISFVQIPPQVSQLSQMFTAGRGFFYAGFICGPAPYAEEARRDILRRVVLRGIGYVYWLQHEPAGQWSHALQNYLAQQFSAVKQFKDFPAKLRNGRLDSAELAVNGALLWDDPDFRPHLKYSSPSQAGT